MKKLVLGLLLVLSIFLTSLKSREILSTIHKQRVNRQFCKLRAELDELNDQILKPNIETFRSPLVGLVSQKKVLQPMCEKIQVSLETWRPFRKLLDSENSTEWQYLTQPNKEVLGCYLSPACPPNLKSVYSPLEPYLPKSIFVPLPDFRLAANETPQKEEWNKKIAKIQQRIPSSVSQISKDEQTLCDSATRLKDTQTIESFYKIKCGDCLARPDYIKLNAIHKKQETLLQNNIDQFKIKWSEELWNKVSCLKGF